MRLERRLPIFGLRLKHNHPEGPIAAGAQRIPHPLSPQELSRDFQKRGCGMYTLTCLRFQNGNPGFIMKMHARRLIPCHGLL